MTLDHPLLVVKLRPIEQGRAQLLDGVEATHPQQLLFEGEPVRVMNAFIPLMERSANPAISSRESLFWSAIRCRLNLNIARASRMVGTRMRCRVVPTLTFLQACNRPLPKETSIGVDMSYAPADWIGVNMIPLASQRRGTSNFIVVGVTGFEPATPTPRT